MAAKLETETNGVIFQTNSPKLYIPVVTLPIYDNIKFLEKLKLEFKKAISWNIYRSEKTTQPKNNNLDYMIHPTFRNINRLFFLLIKNRDNDPTRNYFDNYYMLLVKTKDFNALINNKPLF